MKEVFSNPLGEDFKVLRYPVRDDEKLQAFDASDELILEHFLNRTSEISNKDISVLIISDSFGALTISLKDYSPTSYTDSFVSFQAIKNNSNFDPNLINDLSLIQDHYDYVLIKLPKNMSYFEDILIHLSSALRPTAQILCTGMIKHMPPSAFELLNKYIGETTTSLAKKKARVIFCNNEKPLSCDKSTYPVKLKVPMWDEVLLNHSNLFSREKLDIGTRFFLEHIPSADFKKVLDLGCANGIIGMMAKKSNNQAHITFSDESYMAILSAKQNYSNSFDDECSLIWQNCYENGAGDFDLVLCNPPFHQNNTVGDFIAWQMFTDSFRVLQSGGLIRVIGNRHLGYHVKLKKIFKNVEVVAQNKKFVILDAYKK